MKQILAACVAIAALWVIDVEFNNGRYSEVVQRTFKYILARYQDGAETGSGLAQSQNSGDPLLLQQGRYTALALPNLNRLVAKHLTRFSESRFIILERRNSRWPCCAAVAVQQVKLVVVHA